MCPDRDRKTAWRSSVHPILERVSSEPVPSGRRPASAGMGGVATTFRHDPARLKMSS
jgi:hypothetical protein